MCYVYTNKDTTTFVQNKIVLYIGYLVFSNNHTHTTKRGRAHNGSSRHYLDQALTEEDRSRICVRGCSRLLAAAHTPARPLETLGRSMPWPGYGRGFRSKGGGSVGGGGGWVGWDSVEVEKVGVLGGGEVGLGGITWRLKKGLLGCWGREAGKHMVGVVGKKGKASR